MTTNLLNPDTTEESVSTKFEIPAVLFDWIIRYYIEEGLTRRQAEMECEAAIVRFRERQDESHGETWCLISIL